MHHNNIGLAMLMALFVCHVTPHEEHGFYAMKASFSSSDVLGPEVMVCIFFKSS